MFEARKAEKSNYNPSSNCSLSRLIFLQLQVLRVHISIQQQSEGPCVQKPSFLILFTGTDFSSYAVQNAESQWVCSICGKTTAQKANLFKHIENIHFPGSFSYNCSLCDMTFSNKNSYYKHKNKYHRWNTITTCIIVKSTCLKSSIWNRRFVLKMDK